MGSEGEEDSWDGLQRPKFRCEGGLKRPNPDAQRWGEEKPWAQADLASMIRTVCGLELTNFGCEGAKDGGQNEGKQEEDRGISDGKEVGQPGGRQKDAGLASMIWAVCSLKRPNFECEELVGGESMGSEGEEESWGGRPLHP